MKKLLKNPYFWGLLIGIASLHLYRVLAPMFLRAPPPLLSVGEWTLINHDAKPFGTRDLTGKVYIADFFFTRCPSICPMLTTNLKEVHKRFVKQQNKINFVAFSVDPENDTPEVLRAYRQKFNITDDNFVFVTGKKDDVFNLLVEQMKLHIGDKKPLANDAGALYDISHMAQFALFDQRGDLRGLFGTDVTALAQLVKAAQLLMDRGPDV